MNYVFLDRKKLEEFLKWRDLPRLLASKYETNLEITISQIAAIRTRPFGSARLRSRISPSFYYFSLKFKKVPKFCK